MNKKIKVIIKALIVTLIFIIGIALYDILTINNQYAINEKNLKIPIFLYHDIVKNEADIHFDYMQTTKETFENQINGLKSVGYHFISYDDLKEYKMGKKKLYKKSCLITFDDGLKGVYENAFPIIQKYNIPITMYVITDTMEQDGVIMWEQAKEMQDSGLVTIASHSLNHPEFTSLTKDEAVQNVNKSYDIIENKIGKQKNKIFTYPYGLYTNEQINALKEQGYLQNLTDNKINKSNDLNLEALHRCYPLSDSTPKMLLKIAYRSIRYK